jgi:hypothetical protein
MALIICPDCQKEISSEAKNCPNCGLPIKKIHKQSASIVENSTSFTIETVGTLQRIWGGAVAVFVGFCVLIIPLIGWILSPIMIIFGVILLCSKSSTFSNRKGKCPYCTLHVENSINQDSFSCKHCEQKIIVSGDQFFTIAAIGKNKNEEELKHAVDSIAEISNNSTYRIARNGEDIGEHSISTIENWIETGFLNKNDYYLDTSFNQWRELSIILKN